MTLGRPAAGIAFSNENGHRDADGFDPVFGSERTVYRRVLPAALTFAQRARARATSLARPAAESFRLRFGAGLAVALDLLITAQRARCAARILAIPAALIFFRFGAAVAAGAESGAPSNWLSSC